MAALLATPVAVAMCAAPTEVVVEVYSEIDCAHRPTVGISGAADPASLPQGALIASASHCDDTKRTGSVVLRPSGSRDDAFYVQVMTRDDDQSPETCTAESRCCFGRTFSFSSWMISIISVMSFFSKGNISSCRNEK